MKQAEQYRTTLSGNPEEMEFRRFLIELVDTRRLEDPVLGITKLVIDKRRQALSEKQKFVFQRHVIDEYVQENCSMCSQKIPWCEMIQAIDKSLCAHCAAQLGED